MTGILVIEDDEPIRTALQRGLRDRGLAVASVATGVAALEHVIAERPDVVLLDLGLPDVEGLTLISMIRAASEVVFGDGSGGAHGCCRSDDLEHERYETLDPAVYDRQSQ